MRLLVIGGSDAGIAVALRAREVDPTVEVTLLVAIQLAAQAWTHHAGPSQSADPFPSAGRTR